MQNQYCQDRKPRQNSLDNDQKVFAKHWQGSTKNHEIGMCRCQSRHWPRLRSQKKNLFQVLIRWDHRYLIRWDHRYLWLRLNQDRVSTIHKVSRVSDFGLDVLRLENDLDFDQLQLFYRDLQSCRTTILFCNKKTFNLSAFKNE
jgi:hypothetical protein